MSRLYPLFADLSGRRVLVVGGGPVAERKTQALIDTGARIVVRSPEVTQRLTALARAGAIEWQRGDFTADALDAAWLVIAATGDDALNRRVAAAADTLQVFVNVVDDARLSSFHVPALVNRAPVQVAISSAGTAPALATAIRARIEALLDDSTGPLAALLGRWRERIRRALPDISRRRAFYRRALAGAVANHIRAGRALAAEQALDRALKLDVQGAGRTGGYVALVGAGPGDPGLLTRRGFQLLQRADVILHDRLVSAAVLALARRDAQTIAVGKHAGGGHSQTGINELMREHAARGDFVVRLKGGDPFVFGRGGEELEYLRAHGIDCEVVPGITAALGCAAGTGIPLTHRQHAHALTLLSAHDAATLDAAALAAPAHTLAVYMGVAGLEAFAAKLVAQGRAATTPAALIENGTTSEQRVVTGDLSTLPALARRRNIRSPALLIVGEVASFASRYGGVGSDHAGELSAAPSRAVA